MSLDTNLSEFTAFDSDADHPHEECGVFGVWAPDRDVARLTYFGLRALQHRGQESAGIAVGDGGTVMVRKDLGLVSRVFSNADIEALPGQLAVGHVRYGTAGAKSWEASQPHLSTINEVIVALAHNGTLVNTDDLRRQLIELGVPFNSNSDSEVAVKLIGYFTKETHHLREGIRKTMELIRGGYAMALINENALYAFRDPHGVRPLVLGRLTSDEGVAAANAAAAASALPSDAASAEDLLGDEVLASTAGWVVASETCALDIIGAEYVRDIRPGEILRISAEGLVSEQGVPAAEKTAHCIFDVARIDEYEHVRPERRSPGPPNHPHLIESAAHGTGHADRITSPHERRCEIHTLTQRLRGNLPADQPSIVNRPPRTSRIGALVIRQNDGAPYSQVH